MGGGHRPGEEGGGVTEQSSIDFRPADPRVSAAEAPRLNRQCNELLAAFRAATKNMMTNGEMARICIRYSARILELRRAGFIISIVKTDEVSGERLYWLGNPEHGR
jgi:hypothetical protein